MDFYQIQYSPIQKPEQKQRIVIKKKKIIIYGSRIIKTNKKN
uniref:Uncharacterized protein n=1 Tax=viral metagenome TaxID=1070528 RepID=A0A6C0DBH3_9ZZZZ